MVPFAAASACGKFAVVLLLSYCGGSIARSLRIPVISGYLFAGIAAGPQCLGLLSPHDLQTLHPLEQVSLAIIAFAAGAELQAQTLREHHRVILCTMAALMSVTFTFLWGSLTVVSAFLPFRNSTGQVAEGDARSSPPAGVPPEIRAAVLLMSTVLMARSPASAIAVVKEMRSSGAFTTVTLSVSVAMDVVVIVLFSVNLAAAQSIVTGVPFSSAALLHPALKLGFSVTTGLLVGLGLQAR
eukprot:RCo042270